MGGCGRNFRRCRQDEHKLLVYSTHFDGGFCMLCALFNRMSKDLVTRKFVTKLFKKWNKKSEPTYKSLCICVWRVGCGLNIPCICDAAAAHVIIV